jgi:hypothetical protein
VKTLNEIAASGKTDEKRLRAVELLLDLYARFDANVERKAKAREREQAECHSEREQAAESRESIRETDAKEETDESRRVQDVFARVLRPKEGTDANAE